MLKRLFSALLVCALICAMFPFLPLKAEAAATVEYTYSSTVKCGTIRYISQVPSGSRYDSRYWPSGSFGNYASPTSECGTASMSMALSYIGLNKTPKDILNANNGSTVFGTGWGGSYVSCSGSTLQTVVDRYLNGGGKYSPPVIHLWKYSTAGHYVLVTGRSGNTYSILDPWECSLSSITVSGSTATYSGKSETLSEIHQWYNSSASISTVTPYDAQCTVEVTATSCGINSEPYSKGTNGSAKVATAYKGETYTVTGLYKNSNNELWYRVTYGDSDSTGYIKCDRVQYLNDITKHMKIKNGVYPNGHVKGSYFVVQGSLISSYNVFTKVSLKVYSGFGTSGTPKINTSESGAIQTYTLKGSTIDANARFEDLPVGNYTYVIEVNYKNSYVKDGVIKTNTGTKVLAEKYFRVIATAADQSTCNHVWSLTTLKQNTCQTEGTNLQCCYLCGKIKETTSAITDHSFGSWSTKTAATCTSDGTKTRSCSVCQYTETQTISKTGHSYTGVVTKPTCTDRGYTTYTCTLCKNSYKGNETAALNHNYTTTVQTSTCTEQGFTAYTCTDCGYSYHDNETSVATHRYTAKVTAAPTCTAEGTRTYTCALCNDTYTEAIPETGHNYTAEVTPADCLFDGYSTYTCTVCRDTYVGDYVPTPGHQFENGQCTACGIEDPNYVNPLAVPTIGLKYPSLSFEDVIIMNVYYTAANLQDVAEMGLITYSTKPETHNVNTAENVVPGYAKNNADGYYYSSTAGIAPKDIGDTIYFAVYYKLTDGTYGYSSLIGYSPKTYATNQLKTGSAEMKSLVAAMLNYGAAAQNYFHYNSEHPVNNDMTDDQKSLAAAYSDTMIRPIAQPTGTKLGQMVSNGGYTRRYPTISFEGAFCINYYFVPSATVKGNVTMYVWNQSDFDAADALSKDNATYAVDMEIADNGEYLATVDGIAAKDLDEGVYVSFCYSDGTTEYCSGVIGYSIGSYCKTQAAKTGTLAQLSATCAVYGYYAKQMFNK